MRYLKPHFYDQFVCTAGDCPDTCCAGWQIVIDEDSLERYGNEKSEFGKRLRNSIDWEEECFYQNNRRCAFLNDENLCDLYKALGPDSLCDTCRLYPRHTEEYEGLRELSLSLSCPEAARIILSCKEPVRFLEEETDEEDDFEEFDFMMFSQLEDTRDVLFRILQNRELPLQERMTAQIADAIMDCLNPAGVMVVCEAEHLCMTMRGVKKPGTKTVNVVTRGVFSGNDSLQNSFFNLLSIR